MRINELHLGGEQKSLTKRKMHLLGKPDNWPWYYNYCNLSSN